MKKLERTPWRGYFLLLLLYSTIITICLSKLVNSFSTLSLSYWYACGVDWFLFLQPRYSSEGISVMDSLIIKVELLYFLSILLIHKFFSLPLVWVGTWNVCCWWLFHRVFNISSLDMATPIQAILLDLFANSILRVEALVDTGTLYLVSLCQSICYPQYLHLSGNQLILIRLVHRSRLWTVWEPRSYYSIMKSSFQFVEHSQVAEYGKFCMSFHVP